MCAYWTRPENERRGDNPAWQTAPISEKAQQEALLYLVQSAIRAQDEVKKSRKQKDENTRTD
jgi:hypothetical protein